MAEKIRGYECEFPSCRNFSVIDLLRGIDLAQYQVLVSCCDLGLEDIPCPMVATQNFLEEISSKDCGIGELGLHLFPLGAQCAGPADYEDYLKSPCQCSIIYYDYGFLEVYAKEPGLREMLRKNILGMELEKFAEKTDENDGRTEFY